MPTVVKIKINDIPELRKRLDALYDCATQVQIAKWALVLAKYNLKMYVPQFIDHPTLLNGFEINRMWQEGKASIHEVRQAGLAIHRLAKQQEDTILCTTLRVAGQAVSTGHMKEHGIVASDYAIKCCNLKNPGDGAVVEKERQWQINELEKIINN